ncbi:hypothetical protein FOL47_003040, partial [Perkinsus chesapeaki]
MTSFGPSSSIQDALQPLCADDETLNFLLGACVASTASTLHDLYILGEDIVFRMFNTTTSDCPPPVKLAAHKLWSTTVTACRSLSDHATSGTSSSTTDAVPWAAAQFDLPSIISKLATDAPSKSKKLPVALSTLLGDRSTLTFLSPGLQPPPLLISDLLATDGVDRLRLAFSYTLRHFLDDGDKNNTYPDGGLKLNLLQHALLRWSCTVHLACDFSLGALLSHCDSTLAIVGTSLHGKVATSLVAEKYHHLMLAEALSLISSSSSTSELSSFMSHSNSNIAGNAALASSSTSSGTAHFSSRKRSDRSDS